MPTGSSLRGMASLLRIAFLVALTACSQTPATPQNQPPTASFSASPLTGPAPLSVTFDASSSTDPDGTLVAFAWQFGDGATASGASAAHTYGDPGVYTARLTVTDDRGAAASAQRTITVTTVDGNVPPSASFSASPREGTAPLTVTFDASASSDPDGTISAYDWDFGDGSTGSGSFTSHTYTAPGAFTARLTVTDDRGATASASETIEVAAGEPTGDTLVAAMNDTYQVIEDITSRPRQLIAGTIDAALEATRLNGGVATVTGTLTETATQVFAYSAEPADRLRLLLLDGRVLEITFEALPQGDFSGDGERFLRNPHIIDVRVTGNAAAGSIDLALNSAPGEASGTQLGRFVGSFEDAGNHPWSVDVSFETFARSEVGFDYNEFESRWLSRGTLASTTRGVSVDVARSFGYKLVNTVENVDHRIDHTISSAGNTYGWQGRVFVGFRDAKPVDRDQWIIAGELTENGLAIGAFTATEDPSGLSIWLQIDAERIPLFFFSYF